MNKKIIVILLLSLAFSQCKGEKEKDSKNEGSASVNTIKLDTVPVEFHGGYCYVDDSMNCHNFYISSDSVFDSASGGCAKVKSVFQTGDSYEILCESSEHPGDHDNAIIKKLGSDKISVQFGKNNPSILLKNKE